MYESDLSTGYMLGRDAGNGNNNGWGNNGDWIWVIILLALLGWGNNGFGGNGGGGYFGGVGCSFSPCATQADVRSAVDQQTLISKIDQQTYGLADTFTALNNTLNNNFRGIDNAICTLGYNMQGGFNGIQHSIDKCCCETQRLLERGFGDTNFNLAKGFCDIGNVINNNTRDVLENQNSNTRAILDFLTQDKIATLTAENQALKFQASQSAQNAFITATQDAQTAELIRRLGADCPVNAVVVQPSTPVSFPTNCCGQVQFAYGGRGNYGCGCGCGNGQSSI